MLVNGHLKIQPCELAQMPVCEGLLCPAHAASFSAVQDNKVHRPSGEHAQQCHESPHLLTQLLHSSAGWRSHLAVDASVRLCWQLEGRLT